MAKKVSAKEETRIKRIKLRKSFFSHSLVTNHRLSYNLYLIKQKYFSEHLYKKKDFSYQGFKDLQYEVMVEVLLSLPFFIITKRFQCGVFFFKIKACLDSNYSVCWIFWLIKLSLSWSQQLQPLLIQIELQSTISSGTEGLRELSENEMFSSHLRLDSLLS